MRCQVAIVVMLAVCALGAEQRPSEARDKRGAFLAYNYPTAYPYSYYSPYYSAAYYGSPYASSAYVASPYTSGAYVASPYSAAYTAYYK